MNTTARTIQFYESGSGYPFAVVKGKGVCSDFTNHFHYSLTVGCVLKGTRAIRLGREIINYHPGDLFIIPPHQVHAVLSGSPGHSYVVLNLPQYRQKKNLPFRISSKETTLRFHQLVETLFCNSPDPRACIENFLAIVEDSHGTPINSEESITAMQGQLIQQAIDMIQQNQAENLSLQAMAEAACMSKYHFSRKFKAYTGLTPHQYQLLVRLKEAGQMLRAGIPVADIAFRYGFTDVSHFYHQFIKHAGVTPVTFKKNRHILK
ncbi:MAG: AraC family transcriptional regulator [Ignavibacteria bacterium]|nr:AraC family transcriptional regulator [Ignavibacteria bacterium]